MNEKITLSGVPETMLQTLYARAKETCTRGAIRDEKAAALVERIDYDFALADKDAAMHSGVIARTDRARPAGGGLSRAAPERGGGEPRLRARHALLPRGGLRPLV